MKILIVSPTIYEEKTLNKNKRVIGLGVMLKDIFFHVSKSLDCVFFSTSETINSKKIGNMKIYSNLSHGKISFITFTNIFLALRLFINGVDIHTIKNKLLTYNAKRKFKKIISKEKPNCINYHDLGDLNCELIEYGRSLNIKQIITLHLYIGKNATYPEYKKLQKNENDILFKSDLKISVVSTGMKNRILKDYPQINEKDIKVIVNGTNIGLKDNTQALNIQSKKLLLCIGNITPRKNQTQIVRAISKMEMKERNKFEIYFLGADHENIITSEIEKHECQDCLKYIGKVSLKEMETYYQKASATITVSLNEGFGLTIIEGFSYGLPAIINSDLDSFYDIYNPSSCIAIKDRTDESLIESINQLISTKWNKKDILNNATRFQMNNVAKEYIKMYKEWG